MEVGSQMEPEDKKYTNTELFWILGRALILLGDKHITVGECDRNDEDEKETIQRVSLLDYIARAVADELVEHFGESAEEITKAIRKTKMEFDVFAYPDETKSLGIYNDIH